VSDRGRYPGCIGPEPGWQTVCDVDERVDCERPEQSLIDERDGRLTVEDETNAFVSNWLAVDNANLPAHAEVPDHRKAHLLCASHFCQFEWHPQKLSSPNNGKNFCIEKSVYKICRTRQVTLQAAFIEHFDFQNFAI
jgi:hypothetical protein